MKPEIKRGVLSLGLIIAIVLGGPLICSTPSTAAKKLDETSRFPNIIFIMADDLGYGDLGCYGQKEIKTPHLDRMATEGTRFTQCYAGSTVCAPTRCVLMTGKHTGHARVRGNVGYTGPDRERVLVPLLDEDLTVAEVLQEAGYATGAFGKWGLGEAETTGTPTRQGFDDWFGFLNQRHAHGFYPEYIWENDSMLSLDGNLGGHQGEWIHDQFTDFALDFIRENRDGPFFLYAAYTIPHGRYEIPSDGPYTEKPWPQDVKNYAAMVTRLDADVGKILALLNELGIDENTVVFFTSDNGAEITYFRRAKLIDEYETILQSPGPFRGWKRDLTDGGIRVPMIARWPGRIPANTTSDFVWAFWDFLPTAAALAGIDPPAGIDGISVLPALLGQDQSGHEFLYWEFFERGFQQAVRYQDFKAIRAKRGYPLQLFEITKDPREENDIAANHPLVIQRIEEYLETARSPSDFWPK
ncbi:MAG: arylsulfatase [Verrucomicrobiota bacterium]